jgi:hypothetical protein
LQDNLGEIIALIKTYKLASFRGNLRIYMTNWDDYPLFDGLNVMARAIVTYPELVNVWKQNGYHEIVNDISATH